MSREQHMQHCVCAQHVRAASRRTLMNWKNVMHVHHVMCRTLLCKHLEYRTDHHVHHHQQRVSVLHVAHHTNMHCRFSHHCMLHGNHGKRIIRTISIFLVKLEELLHVLLHVNVQPPHYQISDLH